jgi:hypothetical protein
MGRLAFDQGTPIQPSPVEGEGSEPDPYFSTRLMKVQLFRSAAWFQQINFPSMSTFLPLISAIEMRPI